MQINGKLVTVIRVPADAERQGRSRRRRSRDEKVKARIAGKTVVKVIVVPGKLVNLVVKMTAVVPRATAAGARHADAGRSDGLDVSAGLL